MHTYSTGEEIYAKVNSLTSIYTVLPFSYYSLPYCKPHMGIKKSAENLGQLLMGDQILNSPDRFRLNVNESVFLCTISPLSEHEVKLLKQRTRDLYQVNMILDNLPAMRFAQQNGIKIQWTGFPVGYALPNSNEDYIINHLKFRVLVHEYEGAGVLIIGTGEEGMGVIPEVEKMQPSGYEIAGFEVVPCSVKYDPKAMSKFHMYEYDNISVNCPSELDKSQIIREQERVSITYDVEFVKSDAYLQMEGAQVHCQRRFDNVRGIGRKSSSTDEQAAFRLEVCCERCVQRTKSPASRGMFLTGMTIFYLFRGTLGGYASVRLWITIKGTSDGWKSVAWSVACFFPGICFVVLTVLNFVLSGSKSTGAIPISLYFIPRVSLVLHFNAAHPSDVSVVLTYMHLCAEDWQWWWKAFYASGSVALYVFLFSVNYLVFDLKGLNGPASAILYLGYSLIMAIAIMISTSTIGFLTSLYFVEIDSKRIFGKSHGLVQGINPTFCLCKFWLATLSCRTTSTGYRF
ncbi:Transmembrane 9 superfamily member 12 [Camellia lanceoleosa]|uniref:Transmembrane 9 superfamily member 12 n=1 Tax=Camellia lanceoleosa TaxID=1840588 RepID=A0ACC0H7S3_9ERIC|nr:Transmembrane 9 superfamily member 12 [Camellia lanceoleosa]